VDDVSASIPASVISMRFHNGLVDIMAKAARILRERTGLNHVCASGGTFNNMLVTRRLTELLKADGFEVFTHSTVPCGDGGICLGQALIAAHLSHR
jgi:hydrogenase maturation protein HypF